MAYGDYGAFVYLNGQRVKSYVVEMECPNGDLWRCEYDYCYGAGF